MDNFWLNMGITAVLTALRDSIKDPAKKAAIRPAMLKIASTILAIWGDDVGFQNALDARIDYEKSKLK